MNQHLTWEQISEYLIGDAAPVHALHARECVSCRSEVARLESALSEFRGAVREWTGRMCRTDFQTSIVMDGGAGSHLDRLLTPESLIELPWYQSLLQGVAETIHPRKLPPLELTSKPVDPSELKGLNGLYGGNETRAGIGSLVVHAAMIALLLFLGSLKPVRKAVKEMVTLVAPPAPVKVAENKGGGGGGARQPMTKKAELPKAVKQFVPPVEQHFQTQLTAPASVNANLPDIDPAALGAATGLTSMAGGGYGGGFGNGAGGGIGNGKGNGVGNGTGGGSGGAVYRPGGGVTNPVPIYRPEPQYSEEARKQKWQGTVLVSLVVDESGKPTQIKVIRPLGLGLDEMAVEAVSHWLFKPGTLNGKPVKVQAQIEVTFRLL